MFLEIAANENRDVWGYIWRYALGIFCVVAMLFIGYIPLAIIIFLNANSTDLSNFEKNMDFSLIGIDQNIGLILIIASFAAGLLGLWLVVKAFHDKKFKSIITAHSKIRWERVFWAFGFWMLLSIGAELVTWFFHPDNYTFSFDIALFIPLVLVSFLLLPLQTSFEEIFIRGYLMQGIGLIGVYRFVPLIITSLIFGMLHIMNPEVENFGLGIMMFFYVGFGMLMGILALMDDGLEIPLGIHAANNIYASVFVSYAGGVLQTSAVFKVAEIDTQIMVVAWLMISIIFIVTATKKYGWKNWGRLINRIEFKKAR